MSNAHQFMGDSFEQGLKIFGMSAVTAFRNKVLLFQVSPTDDQQTVARKLIWQKRITQAVESQFVMFNQQVPDPEEHTAGDELLGQQWEVSTDVIALDDKPLVAHRTVSERDLIVAHFDTLDPLGRQCGWQLADFWDIRLFRLGVLAARTAALTQNGITMHNGGNRVEVVAASVAAAFAVSESGAQAFRDATDALAEAQDNDDVPRDNRTLFISPYILRVLQQKTTIFDIDYTRNNANSLNDRKVGRMSGYDIVVANNRLPSTNVVTGPTQYQGDFNVTTSAYGQPAALALCGAEEDMAAIGAVVARGILPEQDKSVRKGDLFIKASLFMGADVMHPWCAGVIDVNAA